ncbi:MAG: hypothetical protein RMJ98_11825 [Myxococcales bacterium]|nr:hypothetical protein [Polyangiaceae bacterium]MDW8249976.1 hypothetical protein [Myxococcales bacterium]
MHLRSLILAGFLLGLGASFAPGCTVDDEPRPNAAALKALSGGGCDPTQAGTCYQPACCQIVPGSKCMAKIDNSNSPRKMLRMTQLRVKAPAKLATKLVQNTIVTPAVTQLDPPCGLKDVNKGGLFNWLIDFDTTTGILRTGGARAIENLDEGYCFLKAEFSGVLVEPITIQLNFDPSTGAFATQGLIPRLVVPIFQKRDPNDVPILLPLRNAEILDGTLSPDGNCIGRYRGEPGELDADCNTFTDDVTSPDAYRFENGGKIQGIITLEEADQVKIVDLNQTLCALLVKTNAVTKVGNDTVCKRGEDGQLAAEVLESANASSTAGGPKDAVQLAAEFAASAIRIRDGECN